MDISFKLYIPHSVYWWPQALDTLRHRFSRSKLGPLWVILNSVIYITTLSFIFSNVFGDDFDKTLLYIATGIIFWNYMSTSLMDCCNAYIENISGIQNTTTPLLSYPLRSLSINFLYLVLNLIFLSIIALLFGDIGLFNLFGFLVGLILLCVNVSILGIFLSLLSARFRDTPFLISNLLQVMFFATPIIWSLDNLKQRIFILELNPFFLLIELIRAPLLRSEFNMNALIFYVLFSLISLVALKSVLDRTLNKVPFWT